ncbi:LysM peptidoglycan-binding domain-containing protein [Nesterenkonia sp. MY13]|uniref:LysM peptidoglycan-binding domain-containing protein n=1 Tax=Nesterenkonia sedimenti TaxID=1463632 RepID=A0A7X8YDX3_9MICC|nr:transglycosylase family protein [Nesterenkonia sedimenti]NLS10178.1 LysM peptidoglycan-binding domain-containing protein [Nesterenkonia sedimenti]
MKTQKTFKRIVGGSMAAAVLAGGAVVAQAPVANAQSDWDRLAECESGGNWSINTGNGFYGGLQFMKATWDSMGGQQYAEYPHQATREQQIAVATELQARYGWGQWPSCSAQLGLSGSPSGGGGNTSSGNSGSSDSGSNASSENQQTESQQNQQSQQQSQPQQQETQQEAPQEQPQAETPAPAAAEFSAEPNTDVEVSDETYTIESGDSLASIAEELDLDWEDLWGANAEEIEDPNLIYVGDELKLPVV